MKRTNIGSIPASKVVGILTDLTSKSKSFNPQLTWEGLTTFAYMTRRQHLLFEQGKNPFEQIPFTVLGEIEYGYSEEYYLRKFMSSEGSDVPHDTEYETVESLRKLASYATGNKRKGIFISIFCKDIGYVSIGYGNYTLIRDVIPGMTVTLGEKQYIIRECFEDMALQCAYLVGLTLQAEDQYYVSGQISIKERDGRHESQRIITIQRGTTSGVFIGSHNVRYSPFNNEYWYVENSKFIFYLEPK